MEGNHQPHAKPSNSRRNIHAYLLSHSRWKGFKGEKNLHLCRIEFTIVQPRYPQILYARKPPPPSLEHTFNYFVQQCKTKFCVKALLQLPVRSKPHDAIILLSVFILDVKKLYAKHKIKTIPGPGE
jgi:hypothetical protein